MRLLVAAGMVLGIFTPRICPAQPPVGTLAGVVRDPVGGVMDGVQVQAVSVATRQARTTATGGQGEFSVPALPPGLYNVIAEAVGFHRTVRASTVEAHDDQDRSGAAIGRSERLADG